MDEVVANGNGGRVAKNTTYLTIALVGQKILSFIYVVILARLVGISSTGDYFSSLSFIGIFTVFVDLGLTQVFIRQTARDQQQGEADLRSIVGFKIISSIIVSGAMLGMIEYLIHIGRFSTNVIYLQIAAAVMVIDSFVITLYGYLRGIQRLEYESLGIILHRVTVMLFGIVGLMLGAPHIMTMLALLAGSIANGGFVMFQLWKRGLRWAPLWNWSLVARLLKLAAPFAIANLFIAVYSSSDNILLQISSGPHDVGLYATSAKIITAFNQIFPAALVAAIFPAMSAAFVKEKERLPRIFLDSMTYLMIVAIPLMVVLSLLAPQIITTGWGNVWTSAAWPLRILAIGIPFLFLNYPVGYLLNAANRQTQNTINIAITVIFNIIANLIFISSYSYKSVAIISVVSSALLFLLGLRQVGKTITIPWRQLFTVLWKTFLSGLFVAGGGWFLIPYAHRGISAAVVAGLLGIIYVLCMIFFGLIRREQWTHLVQRIRRS